MNRKWVIRVVAIIMALIMVLSVLYVVVGSLTAEAVKQSDIDNLKKKQTEIQKKSQELKSQINSMEYEQSTTLAKKEVLDTQIQLTQEDIANINEQIDTYTQLIADKQIEVAQAQQDQDEQWARYKVRIRSMQENGSISYISVIFQANSFSELLARISIVGEIMQADEKLYEQLKASKQAKIEAEASLEAAKAEQEIERGNLEVKNAELETQRAEADAMLKKIDEDIAAAKDLYDKEIAAGKDIQNDINKKIEELKKQTQQVVGTGNLIWPVPSSNKVSSPFGTRQHPIYKDYRKHNGIDISGAGYGAKVLAADDGIVIISKYSSSYGNYIVISHGNNMTTLYAHLSTRSVKEGDKVKQGNVIGKVGSTGASTGPHLHFEVSKGGSPVNPLNYYASGTWVRAW